MRVRTCVIFSALATLASVLALPINLADDSIPVSRGLDIANQLKVRANPVPTLTTRRSSYEDYTALALREIVRSALKERYMDTGIESASTHAEHHYPTASATSKKHQLSRSALRRLKWYARRRRTQRKLRLEDLEFKPHQEIVPPHILARAAAPAPGETAPAPSPGSASAAPQQQVLQMWKKRVECRLLNGTAQCFKVSRIKPNAITTLDAQGATALRS